MPLDRASASAVYATPFHIGGSAATDLNHSIASADIAYHGGRMDGFSAAQQIGAPARQVMGYYNGSDLPLYWNMADQYVLFDRFFSSALGGSLINHYYWVAGGIGGAQGSTLSRPLDVPTIFDRLQQAASRGSSTSRTTTPRSTSRRSHRRPSRTQAPRPSGSRSWTSRGS